MSELQSFLDEAPKNKEFLSEPTGDGALPDDPSLEIVRQLSQARSDLGLSQKKLSERSGLTQANISKMESGLIRPTIDSLIKYADCLGKRISFRLVDRDTCENDE